MKKRKLFTLLTIFLLIPATLFLGTKLPGRVHYLTSTLIILEILIPFFLLFEKRKPQARELVVIAVMSALAFASRAAFAAVMYFKPISAIIMLSGIALGPEAGFVVGAVSLFASNFLFGQGPWTPWQMMAYGLGGYVSGWLYRKKWLTSDPPSLAFFAFFCVMLLVGPLLDTCSVFTMLTRLTPAAVLSVYGAGVPVNLIHAACAALTMLLVSKPLLSKLHRVKEKYGMLEERL